MVDAGPNALICLGDSAQLSATGGLIYTWTSAAGLSNTGIANPKASPTTTTTYTVSTQVEVGNAIVNGDFNGGNTGFTSSYAYTPPPNTSEGQYWVSTNAKPGMVAAPCGDHTLGQWQYVAGKWCYYGQCFHLVPNRAGGAQYRLRFQHLAGFAYCRQSRAITVFYQRQFTGVRIHCIQHHMCVAAILHHLEFWNKYLRQYLYCEPEYNSECQ
ncbi:MAG: hypothetical protein IPH78_09180 [Bacteroidetes bacterium]|nr:hypothetical protein [Bacteroidota bacterium]